MRVLVIRNAYDKDCGGAEQYALNLCIALRNNNVYPILMTRVPGLIKKAQATNIETRKGFWHSSQEWGKHYFLRYPLMVLWYCYVLLRYRIDVVHPQGRDDFIFATQAARLLGKHVVWTDHADLKYILNLKIHPFPYLKRWVVAASKYAQAIICVSQSELDEIQAVAPERLAAKLTLIHNGVFTPTSLNPVPKDAKCVITTNARLVPAKGIQELLEGFSKIKRLRESSLWLVGGASGNLTLYKDMAGRLGIEDKVLFTDYVDNPNDYITSADIFVHASHHEAFSLAVIEAAMLGKPIIATAVGGTPEIIDPSCGVLIPPKNAAAITEAIDDLLDNPKKRKALAKNAYNKASSQFDFSKIVKERILPLYDL